MNFCGKKILLNFAFFNFKQFSCLCYFWLLPKHTIA
nr:MAG TPA: hypothetical protein [Caudoviricetes sp.]